MWLTSGRASGRKNAAPILFINTSGNLIENVDPTPDNYGRFMELMRVPSRKHIPRGCREQYIPGLSEELKSLYEAYKK